MKKKTFQLFIFYLFGCLSIGYGQSNLSEIKVTIQEQKYSRVEALQMLEMATNLSIAYPSDLLPEPSSNINIDAEEEGHFYGYIPPRIVTQTKFGLSDTYYQFLSSQFMETEWRGTLFDSTPSNVKGNVSNGALGFFRTCSARSIQFEI